MRPAIVAAMAALAQLATLAALGAMAAPAAAAPAVPAAAQAGAVGAVRAAGADAISEAETLLFQTNHLRNVRAPATLTYSYREEGSLAPGFDDQVRLDLAPGGPAATLVFLSGARQREAPAVDNPQGNPVLLGFLERDIAEMQRLTGGSGNYFRKRIRMALAQAAQVRPRRFTYAGKAVDGREVVIEPYRDDPLHARFEQLTGKRYTFVVSEQVPGGVYQVRAAVAGAASGAPPLVADTLTLVGAGDTPR
jgi:hypothetical protein